MDFRHGKNPKQPRQLETVTSTAFDGEKVWQITQDLTNDQVNGGVMKWSGRSPFPGYLTLNTLLGFNGDIPSRPSLAESLAQAQSVKLLDELFMLDGHSCIGVEAKGVSIDPEVPSLVLDTRVWVDPERDYRPVRIEQFMRETDRKSSYLRSRLDILDFQNIDGVWLPIKAERSFFDRRGRSSDGVRRVVFDGIQLNQGMPAAFTVKFPKGCQVYDEFLGSRYIKGETSEQEAQLTDEQWIEQAKALSVPELIDVIREGRSGSTNKKWFAAIYRLEEMGSSTVPMIVAALETENKATAQSRLAVTLRAIGDAQAVPGLINALERSGFCSDYGIGQAESPLELYYQKHQMKPSKNSLGVGRPVREITVSLERLTGHSEGYDHYDSYDENGQRLGSYTVTPEIRDRDRAMRKAVAQRWRIWWNQQQAAHQKQRGIMAFEDSLTLEFHIVTQQGLDLTAEQVQQVQKQLRQEGSFPGSIRGDSYQWGWLDSNVTVNESMIIESYQGRPHILLCARKPFSMWPPSEQSPWGLISAQATQDEMGRPSVRFEFNPIGAKMFQELTQNNIGRNLAIGVEGKVVSVFPIQTPIGNSASIAGQFTDQDVERIVKVLRKGIPTQTEVLKKWLGSFTQ